MIVPQIFWQFRTSAYFNVAYSELNIRKKYMWKKLGLMMPWQVWCVTHHLALHFTRKPPYFLLIPGRFSVILKIKITFFAALLFAFCQLLHYYFILYISCRRLLLWPMALTRRGIIQYLEYQSDRPFVRIWSPRTLSCKRVLRTKGGGDTRYRGWGAEGANSDDWRESLACCILCALTRLPSTI